jgi:hypothetical protein
LASAAAANTAPARNNEAMARIDFVDFIFVLGWF